MSAADPQKLEEILANSSFLAGDVPSAQDHKVHKELSAPNASTHPNLWGWFQFVSQFSEAVRLSWPDLSPKEEEKKDDEDFGEDDLFADDPDAEEEAKKIADAKAAGKKAAPVGKSTVVFDVKPVSSTIDLDLLASRVFKEIVMEGLVWGTEYKKAPVAFGINKLVLGCTILDTVETEVIIEKITDISGEFQQEEEDEEGEGTGVFKTANDVWVQSVDIANFQKL
jgi:translation elongation factor EF-1beta